PKAAPTPAASTRSVMSLLIEASSKFKVQSPMSKVQGSRFKVQGSKSEACSGFVRIRVSSRLPDAPTDQQQPTNAENTQRDCGGFRDKRKGSEPPHELIRW